MLYVSLAEAAQVSLLCGTAGEMQPPWCCYGRQHHTIPNRDCGRRPRASARVRHKVSGEEEDVLNCLLAAFIVGFHRALCIRSPGPLTKLRLGLFAYLCF